MNRPLVSVVVPTFRRGIYLQEALQSAVAQTYENLEIIVSDDGSPDPYAEAVVAAVGDHRVRVRRNAVNLGQAGNNLAAFRECRGEFVANLHDDDAWEPTFIERSIAPLMSDETLALAFSDHSIIGPDGKIHNDASNTNSAKWGRAGLSAGRHQPFIELALVHQGVPMAMACVWRMSAVPWQELPADVDSSYDYYLGYLACRDVAGAWYIPERLTRYRVHNASVTATRNLTWCQSGINARQRMLADPRIAAVHPFLRRALGDWTTSLGIGLLDLGHVAEARTHLWQGVKLAANRRAVGSLLLSLLPRRVPERIIKWRRNRPN